MLFIDHGLHPGFWTMERRSACDTNQLASGVIRGCEIMCQYAIVTGYSNTNSEFSQLILNRDLTQDSPVALAFLPELMDEGPRMKIPRVQSS